MFQSSAHEASQDQPMAPLPEHMSLADIAERLPPIEVCGLLVNAYFKGYHSIKPLFDQAEFLEEVSHLNAWYLQA